MSAQYALTMLSQLFSERAANALFSSLWQGVLLTALTALCLQAIPRTTARVRFGIWAAVFLVLMTLPVLNAAIAAGTNAVFPARVQIDFRWLNGFALVWIAGAILRLVGLALQAIRLRALWKSATPVAVETLTRGIWNDFAPSTRNAIRSVELCTSTELDRPSLIGFFAPRILIPEWLFAQLTPGELQQIVLHELQHLRRRDDWLNLLQKLSLVLFPLNPALVWIDRRLATEREFACDDGVLELTRAPRAYATCLTSLAERQLNHERHGRLTTLALSAAGAFRQSEFSRRVDSILSRRPTLNIVAARTVAALLIIGVAGAAAGLAHAPQLVGFDTDGEARRATTSVGNPQTVGSASITVAVQRQPQASTFQSARFQDVSLHPVNLHQAAPVVAYAPVPAVHHRRVKLQPVPTASIEAPRTPLPNLNRRWMVLTSWHDTVPVPVLVALPDGRTFFASYSATPTQVGWLLVQL